MAASIGRVGLLLALGLEPAASLPLPQGMLEWPVGLGSMGPCGDALLEVRRNPNVMTQMLIATGKDLPFDAGKYQVCRNVEEAFGVPTKFFVVNFVVGEPASPGELGVCLPAACRNEDFAMLRDLLALGNGTVARMAKTVRFPRQYTGFDFPPPPLTVVYPNPFNDQDNRLSWGEGTTAAIAVAALLAAVVVYCTVLERHRRPAAPSTPTLGLKLLRAFAVLGPDGSWAALTKPEAYRPSDCLNGLRVVSMLFVIMGHGITQPMLVSGFGNVECLRKSPVCLDAYDTSPLINIIFAGEVGVDTFFFIGGFLLSLVGMSRPTPVVLGTALRYARLLPCLGFTMMVYVLIAPYWSFGPFSPRFQNDVFENCSNNSWWAELLFVSSVFPWNSPKGCMGYTWYLGLDMLFAVVGMVLLNVWKRRPAVAWVSVLLISVVCLAVTIQQVLHYDLQYALFGPHEFIYQNYVYTKFYPRLPVFFVGLCGPWAMRGLERGAQPRSRRAVAAVLLSCAVAVALAAVVLFLPAWNEDGPGPAATARKAENWAPWQNAMFIAFSRPIWATCVLVIVLACYYEYLPLLDGVLSLRLWSPLTKLTYGAYLMHPVIIKTLAANSQDYYRFTYVEVIFRALGNASLAYLASLVLWFLVERPMATLTGLMVPKGRARERKPAREREEPLNARRAEVEAASCPAGERPSPA